MTKRLVEEHGYIDGCVGCEALARGMPRRTHSRYCRTRVAEQLTKSEEGKHMFQRVGARMGEHEKKTEGDCESGR